MDKWWDVVITPVLDGEAEPIRLLAVSRDVTEQRQLAAKLSARAEQLAEADRSKDEFLAMLAHELRNPLAPLRNATALLAMRENSPGGTPAGSIHSRKANWKHESDGGRPPGRFAHHRGQNRTPEKADFACRDSDGRREPGTLGLCAAPAATHPEAAEIPLFVNGDATRLEQVFGNLLNNATKYAGEESRILVEAKQENGEAVVSVSDNGIGIDPELLPKIFDLFVQASRNLDRAHGGLGIGLTLTKRLVEQHGGRISAHSGGLGKGAAFIVRLPILTDPPAAPSPAAAASHVLTSPRRILIVDDNKDSGSSMASLQAKRGHITAAAFSGPEALRAAEEFHPDVILLDIGLPGMDGYQVAREIRANAGLKHALLISMTGYAGAEDRAEALAAGFDEHLVKPPDLVALAEWLRGHARFERKPKAAVFENAEGRVVGARRHS